MSHFIRCDRCDRQDTVMGQLSLPPGWQTILHADLCEPCCQIVKEFIRFKPSDAARLPVEPIPSEPAPVPSASGDKLFETAPEEKPDAKTAVLSPTPTGSANPSSISARSDVDSASGIVSGRPDSGPNPERPAIPPLDATGTSDAAAEASPTEKRETRRRLKKLAGQDAILPDVRKPEPPAPDPGVH